MMEHAANLAGCRPGTGVRRNRACRGWKGSISAAAMPEELPPSQRGRHRQTGRADCANGPLLGIGSYRPNSLRETHSASPRSVRPRCCPEVGIGSSGHGFRMPGI
jgi:hypothetical protein